MGQEMVSTGKAAMLCSVTPDTILKWIKNNKIDAVKTAGGHYRIIKEKLKPYMVDSVSSPQQVTHQINYCWEYHAQNDLINDNCRECMIFKSKAEKCYLLAGLGKDAGHAKTFCTQSCYECDYFHFMNKTPKNVLIISEDQELKLKLKSDVNQNMDIKFSCCGYETASIIHEFRPDYIIIDESMVKTDPDEICNHILNDPRAHGSQIIIAFSDKRTEKNIPDGVCATLKIPFNTENMEECFCQLQKNFFGNQPVITELTK